MPQHTSRHTLLRFIWILRTQAYVFTLVCMVSSLPDMSSLYPLRPKLKHTHFRKTIRAKFQDLRLRNKIHVEKNQYSDFHTDL